MEWLFVSAPDDGDDEGESEWEEEEYGGGRRRRPSRYFASTFKTEFERGRALKIAMYVEISAKIKLQKPQLALYEHCEQKKQLPKNTFIPSGALATSATQSPPPLPPPPRPSSPWRRTTPCCSPGETQDRPSAGGTGSGCPSGGGGTRWRTGINIKKIAFVENV